MNSKKSFNSDNRIFTKTEMYSFYLEDPKIKMIEREISNSKVQYFYFENDLKIKTKKKEVLNGCLLSGNAVIINNDSSYNFDQFDFFFLPPGQELKIKINPQSSKNYKICLFYYPVKGIVDAVFEVANFDLNKFVQRGEHGSRNIMATYRTVWTAIRNGYFMSGFTNIPNESLKQGVITSVNLEENDIGNTEIYPHIHPGYPEVYIMCIDDDKNYAITQYLINTKGQSICRDLTDGEGLFFPGNLGHSNFARPFYKNLNHCMYYWCIATFGKAETVNPITLKD